MYMPSIFNNSVFDNFDNWMDFSFPSFNQRLYGASSSQLMKTDVKETDKDYEVSIDLPGFKKDELQIELKDGYLTVSGSKEVTSKDMPEENQKDATTAEADASKKDAKAEQKTVKYIRQERYSGNVSRSFYVGENLEEKDIHAKFENGTLTLTFPKELEKKAVEEKHFVSIEGRKSDRQLRLTHCVASSQITSEAVAGMRQLLSYPIFYHNLNN